MNIILPETELDKVLKSDEFLKGYIEIHYTKRFPPSYSNRPVNCASIYFGNFKVANSVAYDSWDNVRDLVIKKVVPSESVRRTTYESRRK